MSVAKPKSGTVAASPVKQPMDKLLFVLTIMLIGAGIVTVFDASYVMGLEMHRGDPYYFVWRQLKAVAVGIVLFYITLKVPYWRWRPLAFRAVILSIILLMLVFVPHFGILNFGAKRWIGHGSIAFQPSEFAKLALVLYFAHVTAGRPNKMRNFTQGLLPPLCILGFLALLIVKEPDFGTTIVLCGTGLIILFIAGGRPKQMAAIVGIGACAATVFAVTSPYRLQRLISFANPKADELGHGYQVWHGLIALGSGGIAGRGLGDGVEKLYIPMAHTDFIFAVIGEEWGLIGTITLVTVSLLLAARGFGIAYGTKDPFGALLAAGITALIGLQTLVNMAVVTSSIPDTGVPLPFISYGGSSLVLTMAAMGLLLNISRYPEGRGLPEGKSKAKAAPNETEFDRRWHPGLYYPEAGEYTRPANAPMKRIDRARR